MGIYHAPAQTAATPWLPKKPIRQISTQASTGWEGEGRQALPCGHKKADSRSVQLQIPTLSLQRLLLALCNLLVLGVKFQH